MDSVSDERFFVFLSFGYVLMHFALHVTWKGQLLIAETFLCSFLTMWQQDLKQLSWMIYVLCEKVASGKMLVYCLSILSSFCPLQVYHSQWCRKSGLFFVTEGWCSSVIVALQCEHSLLHSDLSRVHPVTMLLPNLPVLHAKKKSDNC